MSTLTYAESTMPEIFNDIAISIANVHAIKSLPLKKTASEDNLALQKEWIKDIPRNREYFSDNKVFEKYNLDIDFLFNFDYENEIEYLKRMFNYAKSRKNFILNDMNFMNCLVRNNPEKGQLRVVLIDYDLAHYGYRGIDLGTHFFEKRFQIHDMETKIVPGSRFHTIEEKKRFLSIYQREIKRLNVWDDFDEYEIDSVDNLLLESMVGILYFTLYWACHMMARPKTYLESDPALAPVIEFMLREFLCMKKEIETLFSAK